MVSGGASHPAKQSGKSRGPTYYTESGYGETEMIFDARSRCVCFEECECFEECFCVESLMLASCTCKCECAFTPPSVDRRAVQSKMKGTILAGMLRRGALCSYERKRMRTIMSHAEHFEQLELKKARVELQLKPAGAVSKEVARPPTARRRPVPDRAPSARARQAPARLMLETVHVKKETQSEPEMEYAECARIKLEQAELEAKFEAADAWMTALRGAIDKMDKQERKRYRRDVLPLAGTLSSGSGCWSGLFGEGTVVLPDWRGTPHRGGDTVREIARSVEPATAGGEQIARALSADLERLALFLDRYVQRSGLGPK